MNMEDGMKGKELAEIAKHYENFDFQFVFSEEPKEGDRFLNIRVFKNLVVGDIGYSDKIGSLS